MTPILRPYSHLVKRIDASLRDSYWRHPIPEVMTFELLRELCREYTEQLAVCIAKAIRPHLLRDYPFDSMAADVERVLIEINQPQERNV